MKFRQLTKLAVLTVCASLFASFVMAGEVYYNLFTGNERRVSSTVFEFDVYVQATGNETFMLRTVQNTYTFNPQFINGATINVAYIPGSSQIPTFESILKWSNAGNGFTSTANKAMTCSTNGIIVPLAPAYIKVATYRMTAVAGQFGNVATNLGFVKHGEANPAKDLLLKAAVSRWDDANCVKGLSSAVPFRQASTNTGIAENTASALGVTLFPNPTATKTTLSFNAPKADKYVVKVYDAVGRIMRTESIAAAQGYNSKDFDFSSEAAGRYSISIQTNDTDKETLQLIVE